MGFTGVNIIFLILLKTHRLLYSLEPPRRGGSNEYQQSVLSRNMKNIRVFIRKFSVFGGEIFYIFEEACFRNDTTKGMNGEQRSELYFAHARDDLSLRIFCMF